MIEPAHPTERYIEGRIAFNEEGAAYYAKHGQRKLAQWSRDEAEKWREKLKPTVREGGEGE